MNFMYEVPFHLNNTIYEYILLFCRLLEFKICNNLINKRQMNLRIISHKNENLYLKVR